LSALRTFYNYLLTSNITKTNPFVYVNGPKKEKRLPRYFEYNELEELFNQPDLKTPFGQRNRLILEMLYATGVRVGELVNIKVKDINQTEKTILILGKGNKERYTILPKASLEMLRKYWTEYRPKVNTDLLFLNELNKPINQYVIRTHFRKYRRKAKLNEKVTVHTLRHCYATNLIENGATLIQVKELMGHSNIRSTMAYIHAANIDLEIESPLDVFMRGEKK